VVRYGDDEDAIRFGSIDYREGKLTPSWPDESRVSSREAAYVGEDILG
jgi:hypothetical protein